METPSKKRRRSAETIPPAAKRLRMEGATQATTSAVLQRPQKPIGRPWPLRELCAFDLPEEAGWGRLLADVLKARGWQLRSPCHVVTDEKGYNTVHIKEFEASLQGKTPGAAFGKTGAIEEAYRLKAVSLPKHALWFMSWTAYRVPGRACGRQFFRDDFPRAVVEHGAGLAPGDYRICKFPGTETALYKTNFSAAFKDKPWYPTTYIFPREAGDFLKELRSLGDSRDNYWIAKPKNEYGGTGIRVYRGTDPDLAKLVRDNGGQKSVVQRYLADPLLIGGYKFHMRIHLLIASMDPLEAYVQENGQCLFATMPYTLSSKTLGGNFNPPVHVTNMGLNATPANKENYFRTKPMIGKGQQCRMRELHAYLAEHHPSFDKKELWSQILQIAAETTRYISRAPSVRQHGKLVPDRHFETFGMDLMLDKNLKVYMCETNTDPGLQYPDKEVLGSPNPDYAKEVTACRETWHDILALLGLDAGRSQSSSKGSLRSWYKVDFTGMK